MPVLDQISRLSKVLILGFGREGRSTYHFLRSRFPDLQILIADQKIQNSVPEDPKVKTFFGPYYLKQMLNAKCQMVIKSPGISPHYPEIVAAKEAGVIFTSHTQIFLETCPGKIIGVTGTKGKSTTASLIHHVLSKSGISSVLVGNIGTPALDFLDQITSRTLVVMELSSYQLMDVTRSPHIAVMQNIVPDHLDYHQSFDEYVAAKQNICRFQTEEDYYIYNGDFPLPKKSVHLTPASKISYGLKRALIDIQDSPLKGKFNLYNVMPAMIIGKMLGLDSRQITSAVKTFKPLETRLQPIGTFKGVTFYEDALATIPEATIAALDAFSSGIGTLIAGGHERKQKYSKLAERILSDGISTLILFPDTGRRIEQEITRIASKKNYTPPQVFHAGSMKEAVRLAYKHTPPGKICLLSPAAPSFTLFKDYRDEGGQYRKYIKQLST